MKTIPLTIEQITQCTRKGGPSHDELPKWASRFFPKIVWMFIPAYGRARILILSLCRDRWSCEKITGVKIYLGHTAIAWGVGAIVTTYLLASAVMQGDELVAAVIRAAFWGGNAGALWWIMAETADTIQFGLSWDMAYDGLEYAIGFLPHYALAVGLLWLTFLPVPLFVWPLVTQLAVFGLWFHLLPRRAKVG